MGVLRVRRRAGEYSANECRASKCGAASAEWASVVRVSAVRTSAVPASTVRTNVVRANAVQPVPSGPVLYAPAPCGQVLGRRVSVHEKAKQVAVFADPDGLMAVSQVGRVGSGYHNWDVMEKAAFGSNISK